ISLLSLLSLHDALPILHRPRRHLLFNRANLPAWPAALADCQWRAGPTFAQWPPARGALFLPLHGLWPDDRRARAHRPKSRGRGRSEEHTSELQSRENLV